MLGIVMVAILAGETSVYRQQSTHAY